MESREVKRNQWKPRGITRSHEKTGRVKIRLNQIDFTYDNQGEAKGNQGELRGIKGS